VPATLVQGPYQAAYNASKAGLHAFGNTIRPELAREGVGVGVVYFNAIGTEAARSAMRHPLMAPLGVEKMMTPRPVHQAATAIAEAVARRSRAIYVPRTARLAATQPALLQTFTDRWVARRLQRATQPCQVRGHLEAPRGTDPWCGLSPLADATNKCTPGTALLTQLTCLRLLDVLARAVASGALPTDAGPPPKP
jgi:hypothetical protein